MVKRPLWKSLKVGDWVRLIEYPQEFLRPGYVIFPETVRVYKRLVARRRPLRVFQIDEYGLPWIRCRFRRKNGNWEHHWLAINHDGLARVEHRFNRQAR